MGGPESTGAGPESKPATALRASEPADRSDVDIAHVRLAARPGIGWYSASYPTREVGFAPTFAAPPAPGDSILIKNACQTEVTMPDVYQPEAPHIRDAPHISPATPAEDARTIMINQISWGAVLAGVVVALVTQIVLNMLGIGIGAATLEPAVGDNPSATSFSIGAGIWFALSAILAALAGGYAAGRLAGVPRESTAGWHGLTAWALTTLVIFYLLGSTVGGILGGAYRGVTNTLGSVASAVGSTAETAVQIAAPILSRITDPFSSIEESLRSATPGNDPATLRDAAIAAVRAAVTGDP